MSPVAADAVLSLGTLAFHRAEGPDPGAFLWVVRMEALDPGGRILASWSEGGIRMEPGSQYPEPSHPRDDTMPPLGELRVPCGPAGVFRVRFSARGRSEARPAEVGDASGEGQERAVTGLPLGPASWTGFSAGPLRVSIGGFQAVLELHGSLWRVGPKAQAAGA